MQQHITGARIANEIRMMRSRYKGSFAVVEGHSDARFYHKVFNTNTCMVIPAHSKPNVIDAILELERTKTDGVLGIVDVDYWVLENRTPAKNNLFFTEFHDLEVLLVSSDSLENLIRELLPDTKLHLLEEVSKKVRETSFVLGVEIGYLRWLNYKENLYFDFKDLPYSYVIDIRKQTVDIERLIKSVSQKIKSQVAADQIKEKLSELKAKAVDFRHVCQGHDLVFLLELVIPFVFEVVFGKNHANSARSKCKAFILDDGLRLAYEKAYFFDTKLYLSIKDWETKNSSYKVLS